MSVEPGNVDREEIAKFDALADRWWDVDGDFRPLHDINPTRVAYIDGHTSLSSSRVVDVGCGGGILAEALAAAGARVTGIDKAGAPLEVARHHAAEAHMQIEYLDRSAEDLAGERAGAYDVVTCLEMLEHVPDFAATVRACADLARPGASLFFSTINRNPKAYALAVLGAEYVLRLLPRGTHDYVKFIRPAELAAAARRAGLEVLAVHGMRYNPFTRNCTLTANPDVNYLLHARKPDE